MYFGTMYTMKFLKSRQSPHQKNEESVERNSVNCQLSACTYYRHPSDQLSAVDVCEDILHDYEQLCEQLKYLYDSHSSLCKSYVSATFVDGVTTLGQTYADNWHESCTDHMRSAIIDV